MLPRRGPAGTVVHRRHPDLFAECRARRGARPRGRRRAPRPCHAVVTAARDEVLPLTALPTTTSTPSPYVSPGRRTPHRGSRPQLTHGMPIPGLLLCGVPPVVAVIPAGGLGSDVTGAGTTTGFDEREQRIWEARGGGRAAGCPSRARGRPKRGRADRRWGGATSLTTTPAPNALPRPRWGRST